MKDRYGDCDSPETPNKQIRIDKTLSNKKELEIILHECSHAGDWFKDEVWINQFSKDLSQILWKLGYRKIQDKDTYK